jgi:nanoRNase/pAp phosphatase (c-di-AMP/oligoRNAs hydrolase)
VSEIAKQYGGGGHRNASGFTIDYAKAACFETQRPVE